MTSLRADGANGKALSAWAAPWIVVAVAIAIMAPELLTGLTITDSYRYNIVWAEQFTDLFSAGHLYPRWLPRSWDGLGAPTFYFYPPLFFWAASLIDLATFGALATERIVPLASLAFLAGSGFAMRHWLKPLVSPKAAQLGAIAYMAAPYHIYDIYGRGALAEACSYALVPLILVALRSLSAGRRRNIVSLALAYGALVLAHLPSALLTSLFLIPSYVLFEARRSPLGRARYIASALAGGILGIGLSAAYLLPALTLTPYAATDALFGSYYSVSNWFFWRPDAWPKAGPMFLIVAVTVASLFLAAAGAWSARRGEQRSDAIFWFGIAAACFVMISGMIPMLWDLPFVGKVQFPWRLLVVSEFAAITALAIGRPRLGSPLLFIGALPATIAVTTGAQLIAYAVGKTAEDEGKVAATLRSEFPDAPEYLPAGFPLVTDDEGAPDVERIALPARTAAQRQKTDIFYFPIWRVTGSDGRSVETFAGADKRLSWDKKTPRPVAIERRAAPGERAAVGISALSLLAMIILAVWRRRRRRGDSDFSTNPV